MDWLSSPLIPLSMALLGALFCFFNSTRIAGTWFIAESAIDFICNGFDDVWFGLDYVRVHYLLAITAVFFIHYCSKRNTHKNMPDIFLLISILGVINGAVVFFYQKFWDSWGQLFYEQFGQWIAAGYFLIVAALEATLVILGVLHARGLHGGNNNNDSGISA